MAERWTFPDWKANYAHRVRLVAGIKTLEATMEMLPHDDILKDIFSHGTDPNDAACDEVASWEE